MNKSTKDAAAVVFVKHGAMYRAEKSRFGDVIVGGRYTAAFVKQYANDHADVVIDTHARDESKGD